MVDFISIGDDDKVALAFGLPEFELTGEGCDAGVGCVAPRIVEKGLHVELLLVVNYIPSSELLDHRRDGMVLVPNIFFGYFFNVLIVNSTDDGFNANCIDDGLKCELLPLQFLFLLKLEEVTVAGSVGDAGIDACRRCDAGTVEVSVTCYEAHFGVVEDEQELAVMPPPHLEEKKWLAKPASWSIS